MDDLLLLTRAADGLVDVWLQFRTHCFVGLVRGGTVCQERVFASVSLCCER